MLDYARIEQFSRIVGEKNSIYKQEDIAKYCEEPRGLFSGRARLVLRPKTTEEVSQIMRLASQTKTAIVPQAGNTGLVGGQQPDRSGDQVIVSFERMNEILQIDSIGNYVIVESGVVLGDLQKAVEGVNRLFPLSLASQSACQIGGNLSSNAGGVAVLAYGNIRDLCLGLEVVLPDGSVLNDMRFVKKDNSGYDLKNLFIGAEGTLGLITKAVLKIFPRAKEKSVSLVALKNFKHVLSFFQKAQEQFGFCLVAFELMDKNAFKAALLHNNEKQIFSQEYPYYVLIEISDIGGYNSKHALENFLTFSFEEGILANAILAQSLKEYEKFWHLRENMSHAQKAFGAAIKNDISVPIAKMENFLQQSEKLIHEILPSAHIFCFGHVGDGNLHYNISQGTKITKEAFLERKAIIFEKLYELVMLCGGAFSAEHGIGQLKKSELHLYKDPTAYKLMKMLKKQLDPCNIMNPGKLFD